MDSIIRAFWWGHDYGERKLHLINWDRISQPKRMGGLGIKKFKTMNQAMLNKQYWRLCQNHNSLLAKIVKARYFPNSSSQDYRAKPRHCWTWRNIIKVDHPFLREGKWRVGNGYNIPLNHKDWFPCSNLSAHQPHLPTGTVGDLIDHDTRACWHGTTLAIRTSDFSDLSVQHWLKPIISRHDLRNLDSLSYLQDVFITL